DYENSEMADQVKNNFTLTNNYTSFNTSEKFSAIESSQNVLNKLDQNVQKDTVKEFLAIDLTKSLQNTLNNLDQN
ncbi:16602_t:CDS:2, partial [Dentiscutata heterogama]